MFAQVVDGGSEVSMLDERLDAMIALAEATGESLDRIVRAVGGLDQSEFRAVIESPSTLPRYIQSSVSP